MPYVKEVCVAGNICEVRKYFTFKAHGTGAKRDKKKTPTPESVERSNLRRAETKLRRLMNHNFKDGDYLVRLDMSKDKNTTNEDMTKAMQNFIRKMGRRFEKAGHKMKYIYVKEIGKKGGRHIHMMINKCDVDWIRICWTHGGVHIDPLYSNGQYGKIAAYFIKYSKKTEETEGKLIGKRWYSSRTVIAPPVRKTVIKSNSFSKKIRVPKGWFLEADSEAYGISEKTGYEYFEYTLHRLKDRGGGYEKN